MIFDACVQQELYHSLHSRIAMALQAMMNMPWASLETGTHRIDGELLFAMVNDYSTLPVEQCRFEAHRRYTDIQFMISGQEQIAVAPIDSLTVDVPFVAEKDVGFFHGSGDLITMLPGRFAIFFPHDAHRPGIAWGEPMKVRKIVLKVALSS